MQNSYQIKDSKIILMLGDITDLAVDAIVNPANAQLILGGGVAGAIRRKGGEVIQRECDKIGGTFVGGAVITGAGNLKAKYVIHAVGPRNGEGDEENKLKNATLNSLKLTKDNNIKSIAFPAISTGIFGYPVKDCARIMITTTIDFLKTHNHLNEVIYCLWEEFTVKIFQAHLEILLK